MGLGPDYDPLPGLAATLLSGGSPATSPPHPLMVSGLPSTVLATVVPVISAGGPPATAPLSPASSRMVTVHTRHPFPATPCMVAAHPRRNLLSSSCPRPHHPLPWPRRSPLSHGCLVPPPGLRPSPPLLRRLSPSHPASPAQPLHSLTWALPCTALASQTHLTLTPLPRPARAQPLRPPWQLHCARPLALQRTSTSSTTSTAPCVLGLGIHYARKHSPLPTLRVRRGC